MFFRSIHIAVRSTRDLTQRCLSTSGNPFETTIARRRKVVDINMPDFEKQECIKWAEWSMLKDVKRRHIVEKHWQYRNNLMSLAYCRTLPSIVRDLAIEERNSTPLNASVTRLNNRCSITSRPRGKYPRYRTSRLVWRDLADHGLLSGVIRAKWG